MNTRMKVNITKLVPFFLYRFIQDRLTSCNFLSKDIRTFFINSCRYGCYVFESFFIALIGIFPSFSSELVALHLLNNMRPSIERKGRQTRIDRITASAFISV